MKHPKQVHPLSDSELTDIQQVISTHPKPRVRVRAIMIRMSHEGLSAPEIATLLGVSRQTVLHHRVRIRNCTFLVLVIDSVSYHQTPLIARVLAEYAHRVFVLWLPKYCPELSLIERFWEHMKQVVFDNYYFGDESNLEEAVHLFFKEHNTQPPSNLTIDFRLSKNLSED